MRRHADGLGPYHWGRQNARPVKLAEARPLGRPGRVPIVRKTQAAAVKRERSPSWAVTCDSTFTSLVRELLHDGEDKLLVITNVRTSAMTGRLA